MGNYLDPSALALRLRAPMADWVRGLPLPAHSFPDPCELWDMYDDLARPLRRVGQGPALLPFPADLVPFLAIASASAWPRTDAVPVAPGDSQGPLSRSDALAPSHIDDIAGRSPGRAR